MLGRDVLTVWIFEKTKEIQNFVNPILDVLLFVFSLYLFGWKMIFVLEIIPIYFISKSILEMIFKTKYFEKEQDGGLKRTLKICLFIWCVMKSMFFIFVYYGIGLIIVLIYIFKNRKKYQKEITNLWI